MICAKKANEISLASQEKYEVKVAKNVEKTMKSIHSLIKREAKSGHYITRWDWRDCMDRDEVMELLKAEGYNVNDSIYPYYEISWGSPDEVNHKRFRI